MTRSCRNQETEINVFNSLVNSLERQGEVGVVGVGVGVVGMCTRFSLFR